MRVAVRATSVPALAACLAAVLLAACGGGGDGTGPGSALPGGLVGSWAADANCVSRGCGFTLHSTANAADSVNLVAQGIASVYLTLGGSGAAQLQLVSAVSDTTLSGTARTSGNNLIISSGSTADTMGYTLSGSLLRLTFRSELTVWDFTGDQVPDPATVTATFEKR